MARLGMVIDTVRCVGCMDCVVACKTENQTPEGMNRDWITYATRGRYPDLSLTIQSERCNHCDNPPCVHCCPTGATALNQRLQPLLGGIAWRAALERIDDGPTAHDQRGA